ncbi:MAG: PAS domain-containing protein [Proteobacteria bacterium]|nr:PAS domain-containing protein [Pseudomonadota bacterium]MBU4296414.1 PAS domain-containing protein [Pseudomonadota bacterium]MCG2748684.1 ATP-binding protein [Desulfobulbaceae bacterium]
MTATLDTENSELTNALLAANADVEQAEALLAAVGDRISIQDKNFIILYQNRAHINMTGKHCGKLCYQAYEQRDDVCPGCPLVRSFIDGKIHTSEREVVMDDFLRYFEITASPLKDTAGNINAGIEIVREITARKEAEKKLLQQEKRYRELFSHMKSGVIVCRAGDCEDDFVLVDINQAAQRYEKVKREEVIGRSVLELFPSKAPSGLFTVMHRVSETGIAQHLPAAFVADNPASCLKQYYVYKLDTDEIVVIYDDLTKEKEAEEEKKKLALQIQHVQKLESLGVLAGGIAHDFNNLLMAIMGNADLALIALPASSSAHTNIQTIMKASRRAADLCKQMLAYAGKGQFNPERVDINELIRDMDHLLQISVSKKIRLSYHFEGKVPTIQADENQLRQIMINLLINASEAIDDTIGDITIATGSAQCDRDFLDRNSLPEQLSPGLYTFFAISDTGCGMDEDSKAKLFDPFFTTKFPGRGLGMSAVMGIVRGHRGFITISSEPGQGTTIKVYFPTRHEGEKQPRKSQNRLGEFTLLP